MSAVPIHRLRHTFVNRAQVLQSDPGFLESLKEARADWDAAHPDYPIGAVASPPQTSPQFDAATISVFGPASLREALLAGRSEHASEPLDVAWGSWLALMLRLSRDWWPEPPFSHWCGPSDHPARWFVAACLLWVPAEVPADWIQPVQLPIERRSGPATDMDFDHWGAFYEAYIRALRQALTAAGIPSELLQSAETFALLQAMAAQAQWLLSDLRNQTRDQHGEYTSPAYALARLFPGMTTQDWRAAGPAAVAAPATRRRQAVTRAVYDAEGSRSAAARKLGVDRRTIRRRLQE